MMTLSLSLVRNNCVAVVVVDASVKSAVALLIHSAVVVDAEAVYCYYYCHSISWLQTFGCDIDVAVRSEIYHQQWNAC